MKEINQVVLVAVSFHVVKELYIHIKAPQLLMGIFDFIQKIAERRYEKAFRKVLDQNFLDEEVSLSDLRTRVMTANNVIDSIVKNSQNINDFETKIEVMRKLLCNLENDFCRGASIKLQGLLETELPSSYVECNRIVQRIEREGSVKGKWIGLEKIDGFKIS